MVSAGFAASLSQSAAVRLTTSALMLYRFYVENITHLKDIITIELFFLNAKSAVYNVSIICVGKALMFICVAELLLMIHRVWTLIACQLSRQPAGHQFLT